MQPQIKVGDKIDLEIGVKVEGNVLEPWCFDNHDRLLAEYVDPSDGLVKHGWFTWRSFNRIGGNNEKHWMLVAIDRRKITINYDHESRLIELESCLRKIAAMCGNPDSAKGCRLILEEIKRVMEGK